MAKARQAGWTLKYVNADHRFGDVVCPGGEHTFMVDKTARSGESAAVRASALISRCRHVDATTRARQEHCEQMLDEANNLIDSAATGLTMAEARQDAWDGLEHLEVQLQTADETAAAVLRAELKSLWNTAMETDSAPNTDDIADTLDTADKTVERGRADATNLKSAELIARAREHRDRIKALRRRLDELCARVQNGLEQ